MTKQRGTKGLRVPAAVRVGVLAAGRRHKSYSVPGSPPVALTPVPAQVARWAKQPRLYPDFYQGGLGQMKAVLPIILLHHHICWVPTIEGEMV